MRASTAIRAAAWGVLVAGVAAPVVRRRLRLPRPAVAAAAYAAPVALCVVVRRNRVRDAVMCTLQMWAYIAMYEMPADDPEALERRVHIDYPVAVDRLLGRGVPANVRLQRLLRRNGRITVLDKVLVWAHWVWFLVPHGTAAYILLRRRERFPRSALLTYAVFDLGVLVYWAVPTAPPWYAAEHGRFADEEPAIERVMLRYGEQFWKHRWEPLYGLLAGNPLAAMPSLHFATSVMAAHLLTEVGPVEGVVGWTYAGTLGFALVYLGEHYVVDLLAGLALTEGVRAAAPRLAPAARSVGRAVAALEARAHA